MGAKGDCHLLFVPVRESGSGMLALRTGRLPSGQRVGLAFTSAASLLSELGPGQPWIRLHEDAMRGMLAPAPDSAVPLRFSRAGPRGTRRWRREGPPRPWRLRPTGTARHPHNGLARNRSGRDPRLRAGARRQRPARNEAADPSARPARSARVAATSRACSVGFEPGVGVSMNRP